MSHQSAIALGSNLGNSRATVKQAVKALARTPGVEVRQCSSWYQTVPIGPSQPDYINGCAVLAVELTPQQLLETLLAVEQQFGRERRERWGARTLDLDLILFDDLVLETPNLQIPHPRMRERGFVLVPLAEIAPQWIDPVTGEAVSQLVQAVDCSGITQL